MMSLFATIFLGLLVIAGSISALVTKKITTAIISAGIVSLIASVLYLLLAAPDVAMTEAAIGSGLSTIIFFYVLNKINRNNDE